MAPRRVEAAWVWLYGDAAQKATYGRFNEAGEQGGFTKDYLQVSGANADLLVRVLPFRPGTARRDLRLLSPGGIAEQGFVSHSADRKHLGWPINRPPAAWRMVRNPTPTGPATIPGNPNRSNFTDAQRELDALTTRGIQAYLVAIKLADDDGLHLRAYLRDEPADLRFADVSLLPAPVAQLLGGLRVNRACVSAAFEPEDNLYFDSSRNHDGWVIGPLPSDPEPPVSDDAAAENLGYDEDEVAQLAAQAARGDFSAPDVRVMSKSRGSQQRAFAGMVKVNYSGRCALTGIFTPEFLVASHIVPWAVDKSIRLDPSNGICLSTLVDRAFDVGALQIDEQCTAHVMGERIGADSHLMDTLRVVDGRTLEAPDRNPPNVDYLRRRLQLRFPLRQAR